MTDDSIHITCDTPRYHVLVDRPLDPTLEERLRSAVGSIAPGDATRSAAATLMVNLRVVESRFEITAAREVSASIGGSSQVGHSEIVTVPPTDRTEEMSAALRSVGLLAESRQ